jgi:hypothetical protein
MPRRKKPYFPPNHALVDGGRTEPTKFRNGIIPLDQVPDAPVVELQKTSLDRAHLRKKVAMHSQKFDELTQLADLDQFVNDVVEDCVRAQTRDLEHLVRGARSKPDEWIAQILAHDLAQTMRRHGLKPTISEYDDGNQIRQSLYLRLIPGLSKIAGCRVPADVKSHALRARRIKQER